MITTQAEAKRFFADKVVQQAKNEGVSLSDAERRMLFWSESDPEFKADPQLADQLASEISDGEYEEKIAGLLKRRFAADVAADAGTPAAWQQARLMLKQGDHYILIMIDQALGGEPKQWWQFWR